jgi:hypothetical protein
MILLILNCLHSFIVHFTASFICFKILDRVHDPYHLIFGSVFGINTALLPL